MTTSLEEIRDEKAENYWVTVPSNDDNYYNGIDLDTSFKKGFDAALESLDCSKCKHLAIHDESCEYCCTIHNIYPEPNFGCKKFEGRD